MRNNSLGESDSATRINTNAFIIFSKYTQPARQEKFMRAAQFSD